MTRNPSEPGLEIYSQAWFDNIFDGTIWNDPDRQWVRKAAEKISKNWQLGNSSDPLLLAEAVYRAGWDSENVPS